MKNKSSKKNCSSYSFCSSFIIFFILSSFFRTNIIHVVVDSESSLTSSIRRLVLLYRGILDKQKEKKEMLQKYSKNTAGMYFKTK